MIMQALEGVKVVEFAAFAAGPVIGKHLADHGAVVVHVESRSRPDGFRTHYPPYKDNRYGLNRSGLFALCNNNKLDVTLNLKKPPRALDLAHRMVRWADVVIENFTPGTIRRLGLAYEELKKINPRLIMLSTSNMGQTGPYATHPGFGTQLSSLAGFTHLTGYPEASPQFLYGPYVDFIAVGYGTVAILAALDYRRRTGRGQYIDTAQYDAGVQFMAPAILDYLVNRRVAQRMGNRHPQAAPHGAFPCKGEDRWCVISVFADGEWEALCEVMGRPAWARQAKFATLEGRKQNEDELERELARWTAQFSPEEVVKKLQDKGIRSAVVNTMADLETDPQLQYRKTWRELEQAEIGNFAYEGPPFHLSKTPGGPTRPDPLLGEHNQYFYTQVLGLPEEEFEDLRREGVID
ncbi:MAG: CoA transferase [Acidobacteria bacterium]|nr:CoA transferase [Acidobacteriota bacterium]